MTPEEAERYTRNLGNIIGGSADLVDMAEGMGVPSALGLTTQDWVNQYLGGYVRQAIPDRRETVIEFKEKGLSNREIAARVGVTEGTVRNDLAAAQNYAPDAAPPLAPAQNYAPEPDDLRPHDYDPEVAREAAERIAEGEAFIHRTDAVQQARLRHAYQKAVSEISKDLLPLKPEYIAQLIDLEHFDRAWRLHQDLGRWFTRLHDAFMEAR